MSAEAPKVLIVGAGAVGLVYARHLQRGGADVSFFVREKYLTCGVFGALAAMTRLPGIMLLVAFGSAVLWQMARRESLFQSVLVFIELIAGPIVMALAAVSFIRWQGMDAVLLAVAGAVILVGHLASVPSPQQVDR